jgi:two-component system sensor histidine kinase KdpD
MVVAVSELPGAPELVRAAKRIADALRAPWTAVHIETPRTAVSAMPRTAGSPRRCISPASSAPGRVGARRNGARRAQAVHVAEARATQLIVGKSARSRWFELRHGSVVDRLVRETPGIAVHVLPMAEEADRPAANAAKAGAMAGASPAGYPSRSGSPRW